VTRSRSVDRHMPPEYFHHSAGAVVMVTGRCVALRRADRDEWVFPKGHLEMGERPEDAAIREAFGPKDENRKRVDWFLAERVAGELRVEPIFREAVLLDRAGAQTVLTHAADRDIASRAFAMLDEHGRMDPEDAQ
jgi:hypothetical protein